MASVPHSAVPSSHEGGEVSFSMCGSVFHAAGKLSLQLHPCRAPCLRGGIVPPCPLPGVFSRSWNISNNPCSRTASSAQTGLPLPWPRQMAPSGCLPLLQLLQLNCLQWPALRPESCKGLMHPLPCPCPLRHLSTTCPLSKLLPSQHDT